ncbi:MAG TPA: FAD-dependent thymidylate synthase [Firmicutes bacterium]|nr:FAD-dependent thymidylate synthase [Bacillota bacterium]
MKVKLLAHTPEPERVVAAAARLCYSSVGADALLDTMDPEDVKRLIDLLRQRGHESPFEHVSFTFAVEGISRACSHQLVRHRLASFSQQSQRWVKAGASDFVVPPSVARNDEAAHLFGEVMQRAYDAYRALLGLGIPKEDARYVLPNACVTRLVLTMNARELLHVFRLRCCLRAQWEIRTLAFRMLKLCREVAPLLFARAGAPCDVDGSCPEGAADCARFPGPTGSGRGPEP